MNAYTCHMCDGAGAVAFPDRCIDCPHCDGTRSTGGVMHSTGDQWWVECVECGHELRAGSIRETRAELRADAARDER